MNLAVDLLFLIAGNLLLYGWAMSVEAKAGLMADEACPTDPSLFAARKLTQSSITAHQTAKFFQLENQIALDLCVPVSLPLIK
jgi:hypothetical protein